MRTKTRDALSRSQKRRKPSKIDIPSRSTTTYVFSLFQSSRDADRFVALTECRSDTGSGRVVWRTRASFDQGSQSTAEATSFLKVAIASREAGWSGKARCFCDARRENTLFELPATHFALYAKNPR